MRPEEIDAFGQLAGELAAGTTDRVREVHVGIARRIFHMVGPAALPVRIVHDGIAGLAYAGAREMTRAAVSAGALAAKVGRPADAPSIEQSPNGRRLLGALNGAVGDRLERRGSVLALPMVLRAGGRDLAPTELSLRSALLRPSSRLVVFVHGLGQTDEAWLARADEHVPYGFRLQVELGYTPLYVRYNTGRHVSENGRELARLLEEVVRAWPGDVSEIALVGHAMGGLVARAACHYGSGRSWTRHVRHVFMLGAPHNGAPLEQVAGAAGALLSRIPETQAVARAIEQRSAGIKDLRYGYVVDEDWADGERDARPREIPFLPGAQHYFVSADGHGAGRLLVTRGSAWGVRGSERLRFPADHYTHIGGSSHLGLLNHPAVYAQIHRWLCSRRALPAPARVLPPAQRP